MRHVALAAAFVAIAFAGCLDDISGESLDQGVAASSKEDAGARVGDAPSAPKSAYRVSATDATDEASDGGTETTAYPLSLRTNPAKDPVTLEFTGEFAPNQCTPMGNLDPTQSSWRRHDISEPLDVSDVFRYEITLTFENTDLSWGEIHLFYGLGGAGSAASDQEPTGEKRGEVALTYQGQGYRVDADAPAWAAVTCWYGFITEPIAYTLTVTYTFAESAVPSGAPVQMLVPEDASKLIVTGVPFSDDEGVVSHFRVFGPDDELVCECALNSRSEASMLTLPVAGEYVVLVDHTSGGFVGLALDAPSPEPLVALDITSEMPTVVSHEGPGAVDESVVVDLPTTPLNLGAWTKARGDDLNAGYGHAVSITVTNSRGEVARVKQGGFASVSWAPPVGSGWSWYGLPLPGEWDYNVDHHAFAPGSHEVTVEAERCDCDVYLWYQTYVRV